MIALNFLKEKKMIKDGFTKFNISGDFGNVELTALLDEYATSKNKKLMDAKCPKCNANIRWHWCHDTFFIEGEECTCKEVSDMVKLYYCKCGRLFGVQVDGEVLNIDELGGVDWEMSCNTIKTDRYDK